MKSKNALNGQILTTSSNKSIDLDKNILKFEEKLITKKSCSPKNENIPVVISRRPGARNSLLVSEQFKRTQKLEKDLEEYKMENLEMKEQIDQLLDKEMEFDLQMEKANQKLAETEAHYKNLLKEKLDEITALRENNNVQCSEQHTNITLEKMCLDFIKNNEKFLIVTGSVNEITGDKIEIFLQEIDKLISRFYTDNVDLVKHLKSETHKCKKLNEIVNDLKTENKLLK